jgi:hypothetical protein
MRPLLPLTATTIALTCLAAQGCGSDRVAATGTTAHNSAPAPTGWKPADPGVRIAAPASARRHGGPLGDGDADNPGDIDGDAEAAGNVSEAEYRDNDVDADADTAQSRGYHDPDDRRALSRGRPASAAQRRAVAATIRAYFAAAAAGDGAAACALLPKRVASSAAQEYGQGGPTYLQGASGCADLLSRLFAHLRGQLAGHVLVTGVRIEADTAEAFLASPTMLASQMAVRDEGGSWRVQQLTASQLT